MLVLAEEGEEPRAELPQVGGARRTALNERAGTALGPDAPPEDQFVLALGKALAQLRELVADEPPGRAGEDALDVGLPGARAHDPRPRPPAEQKIEGVGEDRLARAGLAGDRGQTGPQPQFSPLDQKQVLNPKLQEHYEQVYQRVPTEQRERGPPTER